MSHHLNFNLCLPINYVMYIHTQLQLQKRILFSSHLYVKENLNTTMTHRGCACIPVKHVSFCNFIRAVYIYTYIWTARISWEGQHNTIIHAFSLPSFMLLSFVAKAVPH